MSLSVAILSLAVLILVHEAGHFFVARAVGMTPRKFYIGFGPPLVKRIRGGVEYGIAAIPLGGYVKIPGMHRPAPGDLRQSLQPQQQHELEPQLDALDAALERDDEPGALAIATQLEPSLPGSKMLQELEWALAPDAYWRQRVWKKVVVIAAGPLTNVLFAIVLLVIFFMLGSFKGSRVVDRVLAGHPAAAAGIKPGDQIEVIDRHPVTPDTLATRINATHGKPFTIVILRKGHRITIGPLRARLDQGVYRIGIQAKGLPAPGDSFPTACWHAVRIVGVFTSETVKSLAGLFVGHGTRNVSSAVGIVRVTSQAFKQSFQDFIGIVAEINLALALLNLLPVLPLDGGHIVISIIERIRRRPFSQLAYMRYSAIGLSLFIFLLYLGLRNDFSPGHS